MPEMKIITAHCRDDGLRDLAAYLSRGGFAALNKARTMKPELIIDEIKRSGLTGRGGAGFATGLKWELARKTKASEKYLICNADEGEVGTFKDRLLLSRDPFTLIEGMAIAALAIGAAKAFIYLRAEYHFLMGPLRKTVSDCKAKGFLPHVDIEVFEGAGAYICGEESALMNSLEGRRGESRYKPPFPPTSGLRDKPTIINNIETLMNVPPIIQNGAAWFSAMGTKRSKGTKVFSVSGDVARPGVYELLMGSPLRELVDLAGARDVKAVQVGGSTGRIIPAAGLDVPLAHESVLGSGAVVVFDSTRDIIALVHNNLRFLHHESCGKCVPCRDGLTAMLDIFERLMKGDGAPEDLLALEQLSQAMSLSSLCGLGQAAPVPVMDSLKHFRREYEGLVRQATMLRSLRR